MPERPSYIPPDNPFRKRGEDPKTGKATTPEQPGTFVEKYLGKEAGQEVDTLLGDRERSTDTQGHTKANLDTLLTQAEQQAAKESLETRFAEAKELLGQDFLGPETIGQVWNIDIAQEEVPEIPFSKEELEKAKELGQFLILRATEAPDGSPLTMFKMYDLLNDKMQADGKGKLLDSPDDWYKTEDFATKETPVRDPNQPYEWALVTKELIPDSTKKNYLEQTKMLADYLDQAGLLAGVPGRKRRNAVTEFMRQEQELKEFLKSDWQPLAKQLAELKINQDYRPTPTETLYDHVTYFQVNNHHPLEDTYIWTNRQSSDGHLVYVGLVDDEAAYVDGWRPDGALDTLGVAFSRRA